MLRKIPDSWITHPGGSGQSCRARVDVLVASIASSERPHRRARESVPCLIISWQLTARGSFGKETTRPCAARRFTKFRTRHTPLVMGSGSGKTTLLSCWAVSYRLMKEQSSWDGLR